MHHFLWLSCLTAAVVEAQSSSNLVISGTVLFPDRLPTGSDVTYLSYESTLTTGSLEMGTTGMITAASSDMGALNATASSTAPLTSKPASLTVLTGGQRTSTLINGTITTNSDVTMSSTTSVRPTNTQPCNNYPEFCTRRYSNITEVCAHNSPFVRTNNAASNQQFKVTQQLDDGIRMLQGQVRFVEEVPHFCHSSCELFDAGLVEDYLKTVKNWLNAHPYEVLTILLGNPEYRAVGNFTTAIRNSGIARYLYEPPKVPMSLDDWPTLSEMILLQKRVVFFLDYEANQTAVPYILDEFSQMWETPFSPTDVSFPCTVERPPNLPEDQARQRLYIANHNLNVNIDLGIVNLLLPNTAQLTEVNGLNGSESLGQMAEECKNVWNRPPNFLLVDYYNYGEPNGSVFGVAAEQNNVTYNRKCCGIPQSLATPLLHPSKIFIWTLAGLVGLAL
ncbi:PLC-like phosphodiesterase [Patellaria atrata CBS 101060]|uniref:PLC-like phosphodiesterase n=1 Tax=Patellaria atrata CBS 101060 TaxID=1346257 RepID=A0A9P4VSW7_9PEZI|nr:PLC-like phosphodiesterase [Patellaria atrata CBS 101060]